MRALRFAAIAVLAAAGIAGAACESATADEDPTPVQTWKITPASGTVLVPTATVPPATPTVDPNATPGSGATTTLELAGVSSVFDKETLEAPAGTITIEFDNRDAAIVHNVHVFRGDSADGESVGETELEVGPIQQTLTMTLEPGEYFYQCDAHPTTMSGTLTVT